MSSQIKCRMDIPGAQAPTNFLEVIPERSLKEKRERAAEFWTWATADSTESVTCFECGIESLVENKEDFKDFWISLTVAVSDGKLPELKEHMDKFIWSAVEMNQDDWA